MITKNWADAPTLGATLVGGAALLRCVAFLAGAAFLGCATSAAPAIQSAEDAAARPAAAAAPSSLEERAARGEYCTTIRRGGAGDAHDTRVAERWPDRSYGNASAAFTGKIAGASRAMLVGFDLGSIPRDARITWAKMSVHALTCATCASQSVTVHRVTAPWDERTSTWKSFDGSYEKEPFADTGRPDGENGDVAFDVTGLVRQWVNGEQPNRGVALVQANGTTAFTTSESDAPGLRPKLEVCFAMNSNAAATAGHATRDQ